jgi:hypothetical protein
MSRCDLRWGNEGQRRLEIAGRVVCKASVRWVPRGREGGGVGIIKAIRRDVLSRSRFSSYSALKLVAFPSRAKVLD